MVPAPGDCYWEGYVSMRRILFAAMLGGLTTLTTIAASAAPTGGALHVARSNPAILHADYYWHHRHWHHRHFDHGYWRYW
jgi:hypothetical protein